MNNEKWSQKPLITEISNTTEFCILDEAIPKNKRINAKALLNAVTTNDLNGTQYVMVHGTGTPEENARELQAAYNAAKTMPRYLGIFDPRAHIEIYKGQTFINSAIPIKCMVANSNYSGTVTAAPVGTFSGSSSQSEFDAGLAKRVTVIIAPGEYNFGGVTTFNINAPHIDIKSLTGKKDVLINSVHVSSDFVYVNGINCRTGRFIVSDSLPNIIIENCEGGNNSFGGEPYNGVNVSGTFIDCVGANYSFGSYGTASGTFIRCIGGNNSFGYKDTASGVFNNCVAGNNSFGAYNIASGTFKDCIGGDYSFGAYDIASGTFINCNGGYSAFGGSGGTASGTFNNCNGGPSSFGGSGGFASGTFNNCNGYEFSFGGNGTLSGKITNCTIDGVLFTHKSKEIDLLINRDGIFQNIKSDGQGFTPVAHPNYSTQTTILPQKFGNQLVYQKVIMMTNPNLRNSPIPPLISYDDSIIPLSANIISVKGYYEEVDISCAKSGIVFTTGKPTNTSHVQIQFEGDIVSGYQRLVITPHGNPDLREVCLIIEYTIPTSEYGYGYEY